MSDNKAATIRQLNAACSAIRNGASVDISHLTSCFQDHVQANNLLSIIASSWCEPISASDSGITSSSGVLGVTGSALELLRVATSIESISQRAICIAIQNIQDGRINGRSAIHCLSEIRIALFCGCSSNVSTNRINHRQKYGANNNSSSNQHSNSSSSSNAGGVGNTSYDCDALLDDIEFVREVSELCIRPFYLANKSTLNLQGATICLDLFPVTINALASLRRRLKSTGGGQGGMDAGIISQRPEIEVLDTLLSNPWQPAGFLPM